MGKGEPDFLLHGVPFFLAEKIDHIHVMAYVVGGELIEGEAAEVGELIVTQAPGQVLLDDGLADQLLIEIVDLGAEFHGQIGRASCRERV